MMKYIFKIACSFILILCISLGSCKNEDLGIGDNFVDSHTTFGVIDTVTIKVSNIVAADSVVTSDKGVGFSGIYYDPQIGTVQAQTFIEFYNTENIETNRYATFDSITLVLRPNGNYYGDTIKSASFEIYELTKQIEKRDDGFIYSNSEMPIGDMLADTLLKVKIKDLTNNEIEIKLERKLGEKLFYGILNDDDDYKQEDFFKTFPGIAVRYGADSECLHGFLLNDTTCMIRIYYHVSTTFIDNKQMIFKANRSNSFYNMTYDKSRLPADFNSQRDPLPSSLIGDRGIIMSGSSPIYTRLEFPHLNELIWLGQLVTIQKATLFVRPIINSYDTIPLPPKICIYNFDPTSNSPLGSAIKMNSVTQYGNLPEDYKSIMNPDFPQYSFDVTDFISGQLGAAGYNKWALCLIIPPDEDEKPHLVHFSESSVKRLVFGNQNYWYNTESQSKNNQVKLEVIYAAYND